MRGDFSSNVTVASGFYLHFEPGSDLVRVAGCYGLSAGGVNRQMCSSPTEYGFVADTVLVTTGVDEVDIALLDVLHAEPRVSFDEAARVLGVSGVTAARRWQRLERRGLAWISSAPGPRLPWAGALVEAQCLPARAQQVADQWACVPQVFSVHVTTGHYNVYALIVAAGDAALVQLVMNVLPSVSGIQAVRTAAVPQLISGTNWRLGR